MSEGDVTTNTLYKDRPDFKDVVPIYNSKVEDGIVPIALNEECKFVFIKLPYMKIFVCTLMHEIF